MNRFLYIRFSNQRKFDVFLAFFLQMQIFKSKFIIPVGAWSIFTVKYLMMAVCVRYIVAFEDESVTKFGLWSSAILALDLKWLRLLILGLCHGFADSGFGEVLLSLSGRAPVFYHRLLLFVEDLTWLCVNYSCVSVGGVLCSFRSD